LLVGPMESRSDKPRTIPQVQVRTRVKLNELALKIGAKVLTPGKPFDIRLDQVYAGDRISDLLNAAGDHALLVTNLASAHLVRVAELMDIPGICVVNGQTPDPRMLQAAEGHGTLLMVSPKGLFETSGRIHQCLAGER
jgi:hypothetical protein